MARTDPQINVRLPIELKERLGAAARANARALNAEIVNRLEASFRPVERPTDGGARSRRSVGNSGLRGAFEKLQTDFEEFKDFALVPDFTKMTKPEEK